MLRSLRFLLLLSLTSALLFILPFSAPAQPNLAVATGRDGAVASVDRRATQIGIDVLRAGGNAIDAAVATAAALGVTEPFSCGIGGGDFMLIYLRDQDRIVALDGREVAPATASVGMFIDPNNPRGELLPFLPNRVSSGVAVGVPGTLLTWVEALNRYGSRTLSQVLNPAIALAETGFEVDPTFFSQVEMNQDRFSAFTSTQALYLPQGRLPAVGSRFRNPDLAKTYRLLAQQGANTFYRGEIGEAIVQTVQRPPTVSNPPFPVISGGMTMTDMERYGLRVRAPVTVDYRNFRLHGMGLPSSGGITSGEVLNIVSGFDLGQLDRAKAWHTLVEAERLAYADRNAYLGDPEFVDAPVAGLLNPSYAQSLRQAIGDRAPQAGQNYRASAGNPFPFQNDPSPSQSITTATTTDHEGLSTTHLSVVDRWGNVVSYTLTIESIGGSGMVVPGYGFLLNNELTDFDPLSPHPNAPEPRKKPRSNIAPTLAFSSDGRVLAYGSPGGSTIITTVLGITVNVIDFGLSLDQAIAAPRISQRNSGVTQVDSGFELSEVGQAMAAMGHIFEPAAEIGAATGVQLNPDGTILAAAEPTRRGGGAAMVVTPSR
jgi:gamma-glutamyltranspeptidase/glutathione hydrolase